MMLHFKVFHDYGYPALYAKGVTPFVKDWTFIKTLEGEWRG